MTVRRDVLGRVIPRERAAQNMWHNGFRATIIDGPGKGGSVKLVHSSVRRREIRSLGPSLDRAIEFTRILEFSEETVTVLNGLIPSHHLKELHVEDTC